MGTMCGVILAVIVMAAMILTDPYFAGTGLQDPASIFNALGNALARQEVLPKLAPAFLAGGVIIAIGMALDAMGLMGGRRSGA